MKIEKFDKETLKLMREEINAALAPLAQKFGLESIALGSISYEATRFSGKVEVVLPSRADDPAVKERTAMEANILGLPEDIIGTPFVVGRDMYEVVRLDLKKRKFPVIAKNLTNGNNYKFSETVVLAAIKK